MNKKEQRKKYIEIRKNIDAKKREEESVAIVKKLHKIINENRYDAVLLYAPLDYEVDVFSLFDKAAKEEKKSKTAVRKNFCFPRVNGDEMDFFYINDISQLEPGSFGVREPKDVCRKFVPENEGNYLIIVPGVCFGKRGYRIGYGKGYYDKYLSKYKGMHFTKIGVCFDECISDAIENDEHDMAVDFIISPNI